MLNSIELTDLTAENAVEKVVNALVDALGWIPDEDGERVWINENRSLGAKVSLSSTNLSLTTINKQNNATGSIVVSINAPITFGYEKGNKNKSDVILGLYPATEMVFSKGAIIFARKSDGVYGSLLSSTTSTTELCEGLNTSKTHQFSTITSEQITAYTAIFNLPSLFGGVYEAVFCVFSCPSQNSYLRFTVDGRVFQASSTPNKRLALEVSE